MSVNESSSEGGLAGAPPSRVPGSPPAVRHGSFGVSTQAPRRLAAKRAFDLVSAAAAALVLMPLLAAIAIAIKIDSRGPVLFRQRRHGRHRQPFMIWKFRSMAASASDEPFRQANRDDPRTTRIGKFLRRTSLDELPQLWNVLNGTMSLVGPRPHPTALDEAFEAVLPRYFERYSVTPGVTGWAQINGFRGETTSLKAMADRIDHDIFYVENGGLLMDLRIIFLTVFSVKPFEKAY